MTSGDFLPLLLATAFLISLPSVHALLGTSINPKKPLISLSLSLRSKNVAGKPSTSPPKRSVTLQLPGNDEALPRGLTDPVPRYKLYAKVRSEKRSGKGAFVFKDTYKAGWPREASSAPKITI